MDLATSIVEMAMHKVGPLIKEEFLLTYGVKKDVEKLESTLHAIQAALRDAERKQSKEDTWNDWLGKIRDAAYDAEDILDAFSTQVQLWKREWPVRSCPPFIVSRFLFQNHIAHKIREIVTKLDDIEKDKKQFGVHTGEEGREPRIQNTSQETISKPDSGVVGRKAEQEKIIDLLISDQSDKEDVISVIPIIGMGGLGKTTLAQLVYEDENVKKHFNDRIWVSVPVDFDISRILNEILRRYQEMKHDDTSSLELLGIHFGRVLGGKKFLLVLDGVWFENNLDNAMTQKYIQDWDKLKNILKQGQKGSKVLVTSRSTEVSNIMRTQPAPMLENLSDDECWSLFQKHAFGSQDNLPSERRGELEKIGRDIIGKCQKLPLAVKMIACLLRRKDDPGEWKELLKNWEGQKNNTQILSSLKLSYDYLPPRLKPSFAFCSLFPKAYLFDKKELVKLWIAEGFIPSSNGQQITGSQAFDELLSRSFFQRPPDAHSKDQYRMHDLIHDVAQHVSSSHGYTVEDNNQCNVSQESRHVSFLCEDRKKPASDIIDKDSKKLRTLLFPRQYLKDFGQLLDKMFHSIKYVRVLDLSSSTISQLPTSIEKLSLLRYLDLSKTEIRMLPESICNLWNLQTLKLLGCVWLSQLPRDLGKLIHLMHLELDEIFWYNAPAMPPRMGKLTLLHNLHAFQIGSAEDGCGIEELKDMKNLTGTLHISKLENAANAANAEEAKLTEKTCLDKLVLEWSNRDADPEDQAAEERVLEDLQPHSNLEELQICHYRGTRLPVWMRDGLFEKLVTVSLKHCTNCRVLSLGRLPNLRRLCIKGMQELEVWPEEEFPSLVRLKISNCPKLRQLPEVEFGSLEILKISNCPKLRKLPSCFPGLQILKIKKCDSLKAFAVPTQCMSSILLVNNPVLEDWQEPVRISSDDERISSDDEHISNDDERISNEDERISNDDELFSCEKPLEILPVLILLASHSFLELKIICCPKLPALPQLSTTKLEISGCELLTAFPDSGLFLQHLVLDEATLVKAIPEASNLISLVISNISNATSLPKLPDLPELKALYIHHCKDLVSLSQEAAPLQRLTSLELLSIESCPELVSLPDEGLPKKLECLMIGSCPNFESLGPNDVLKSLTSLKDLYIEDCPKLKCLPEEGVSTSLQHLVIQGCPLLMEQCRKEGPYWPKIERIPDLEISSINASSTFGRSVPWYHCLACCLGIDERETGQPSKQRNNLPGTTEAEGQNSKGKKVLGEASTSA